MGDTSTALLERAAAADTGANVLAMHPVMASIAVACALLAAALLLWFYVRKPELTGQVKFLLLLGFGVFPIGAAATGNVAGFEHTKHRSFCGSCHVMTPYLLDADNLASRTLASAHSRNETFGRDSCYECHQEYGAFSTVMTKLGGMRHVYHYYTHYRSVDVREAVFEIEMYEPMANASCMRCHSTTVGSWLAVGDHRSSLAALRSGEVGCAGDGCHGPAHPFSKPKRPAHAEAGP